jgi:hypothetical protein
VPLHSGDPSGPGVGYPFSPHVFFDQVKLDAKIIPGLNYKYFIKSLSRMGGGEKMIFKVGLSKETDRR